jgi:hypothetical protein
MRRNMYAIQDQTNLVDRRVNALRTEIVSTSDRQQAQLRKNEKSLAQLESTLAGIHDRQERCLKFTNTVVTTKMLVEEMAKLENKIQEQVNTSNRELQGQSQLVQQNQHEPNREEPVKVEPQYDPEDPIPRRPQEQQPVN